MVLNLRFESCLGTTAQWSVGKLYLSYLHLCITGTKQYNLAAVKGR